jgi:hypothetical protein
MSPVGARSQSVLPMHFLSFQVAEIADPRPDGKTAGSQTNLTIGSTAVFDSKIAASETQKRNTNKDREKQTSRISTSSRANNRSPFLQTPSVLCLSRHSTDLL